MQRPRNANHVKEEENASKNIRRTEEIDATARKELRGLKSQIERGRFSARNRRASYTSERAGPIHEAAGCKGNCSLERLPRAGLDYLTALADPASQSGIPVGSNSEHASTGLVTVVSAFRASSNPQEGVGWVAIKPCNKVQNLAQPYQVNELVGPVPGRFVATYTNTSYLGNQSTPFPVAGSAFPGDISGAPWEQSPFPSVQVGEGSLSSRLVSLKVEVTNAAAAAYKGGTFWIYQAPNGSPLNVQSGVTPATLKGSKRVVQGSLDFDTLEVDYLERNRMWSEMAQCSTNPPDTTIPPFAWVFFWQSPINPFSTGQLDTYMAQALDFKLTAVYECVGLSVPNRKVRPIAAQAVDSIRDMILAVDPGDLLQTNTEQSRSSWVHDVGNAAVAVLSDAQVDTPAMASIASKAISNSGALLETVVSALGWVL